MRGPKTPKAPKTGNQSGWKKQYWRISRIFGIAWPLLAVAWIVLQLTGSELASKVGWIATASVLLVIVFRDEIPTPPQPNSIGSTEKTFVGRLVSFAAPTPGTYQRWSRFSRLFKWVGVILLAAGTVGIGLTVFKHGSNTVGSLSVWAIKISMGLMVANIYAHRTIAAAAEMNPPLLPGGVAGATAVGAAEQLEMIRRRAAAGGQPMPGVLPMPGVPPMQPPA